MNHDEIAFFNQQLAGMLRAGIPLEGALERLCGEMKQGRWRTEIEALLRQVRAGRPLAEAARESDLPELYRRMLETGVRTGNLPQVLNEVADHYRDTGQLMARIRGAVAYPLITLFGAAALSLGLCGLTGKLIETIGPDWTANAWWGAPPFSQLVQALAQGGVFSVMLLAPVVLLVCLAAVAAVFLLSPRLRRKAAWRLPVFREASLARASSAVAIALRREMTLADSLALAEALEPASPAAAEWRSWRTAIAAGQGGAAEFAARQRTFPRVFGWLLVGSGEDMAAGFQQAKTVFAERAAAQADRLLVALTPALLLFVGVMLVVQMVGAMRVVSEVLPWLEF